MAKKWDTTTEGAFSGSSYSICSSSTDQGSLHCDYLEYNSNADGVEKRCHEDAVCDDGYAMKHVTENESGFDTTYVSHTCVSLNTTTKDNTY